MTPAIVILAGGDGRRIGGAKPLRRLGDRSLLERAIERARGWSDEVVIAVRSPGQIGETEARVMIDPPGLDGPLGGLGTALRLARPAVLTIPCDAPFLPDDLPERLGAALPGHGAALAASAGQVHPTCALWRTEALMQVRGYAASGRRSLIGFARGVGYATVEWPGAAFFNINTPEQLAEAEARLG